MGFTHHWYRKEKLSARDFEDFSEDVKNVLKVVGIPLSHFSHCPYGGNNKSVTRGPEVTPDLINFNGKGKDGHETFFMLRNTIVNETTPREDGKMHEFCKTNHKPYDVCVTATLILAKMHFGKDIVISSDGEIEDWQAGKELVKKALDVNANLDIEFYEDDEGKDLVVYYEEKKVKQPIEDPEIKELERQLRICADENLEEIIG